MSDCPPVGLESLRVSDYQLQASSSLSSGSGPHRRHLNTQAGLEDGDEFDGAWCAEIEDKEQWLQLDALRPTLFTGVILQGRSSIWSLHWVTQYKVQFSNDSVMWQPCMNGSQEAVFVGSQDQETPVLALFPEPIVAHYIRINPQSWYSSGTICLRAEILGCSMPGYSACNNKMISRKGVCRAEVVKECGRANVERNSGDTGSSRKFEDFTQLQLKEPIQRTDSFMNDTSKFELQQVVCK